MKKYLSAVLLAGMVLLPVALIVGFSYTGSSHPIENRVLQNDGFLDHSENKVEVVFFGFPGCATVCPASLSKLSSVLESPDLADSGSSVGAVFINVNQQLESGSVTADSYSRSFSDKIRGFNEGMKSYQSLSREFALRVYSNRTQGSQISHTDHFFVLNRQGSRWNIHRVLDNSVKAELLQETIADAASGPISGIN